MFPEQQPPVHEDGVHEHVPSDVLQACPNPQPVQAAPPVPQEVEFWDPYGSHVPFVPPLQHPFGHDVASQMHTPALQRWPEGHGEFVPHLHTPLVHALVVVGSHCAHVAPAVPHDDVPCEP